MHRMPQIGELAPGVWLASGFGGHGLNTTAMAGNIIARAIVEGDESWRQFTPFELVWAGGVFGRFAAQVRMRLKRLRDRIEERQAKARELARRHAREAEIAQPVRELAARQQPAEQDRNVAEAAASPATDFVTHEEPVSSADPIIPPTDGVVNARQPELRAQGASAGRPKRRRRRQPAKQSADQDVSEDAKP